MVTPEELETFIAYMNDNSEDLSKARLGKEIEFMERNGFDSSWLLNSVKYEAKDFESPILSRVQEFRGSNADAADREAEFARALHLQLRDYFRRSFGRPPLTGEERANWPIPPEWPPGFQRPAPVPTAENIQYHTMTPEEAVQVASYVKTNFPDVVRYYHALIHDSASQGYNYPDDVGNVGWFQTIIGASASAVLNLDYVANTSLVEDLF